MDLAALKSKALFIPTNGQTEQEYLAKSLKKKGIALFVKRQKLNLRSDYEKALKFKGFESGYELNHLSQAVNELKTRLNKNPINNISKVG